MFLFCLLSLLVGGTAGLGFNAFNHQQMCLHEYAPLLTLFGFSALGSLLQRTQRSLVCVYCFGLAYHTVSVFWVGSAFHYTAIPFVKPFVSFLLALLLALQFPVSIGLAQRYKSGSFTLKWVSIFALLDFLRTVSPLFFPWNPMGFIAGDFCLSSVRWWGIFGLSWFMLLVSQIPYVNKKWQMVLMIVFGFLCLDHYLYQKKPTEFTPLVRTYRSTLYRSRL